MSEFKTADEKEPEIVEKGDLDDAEDGDNEPAPVCFLVKSIL